MEIEGAKLTDAWIKEQLERCQRASRVPWCIKMADVDCPNDQVIYRCRGETPIGEYPDWWDESDPRSLIAYVPVMSHDDGWDIAWFICEAHQGYPLLLKELLRLRNQRCKTCKHHCDRDI